MANLTVLPQGATPLGPDDPTQVGQTTSVSPVQPTVTPMTALPQGATPLPAIETPVPAQEPEATLGDRVEQLAVERQQRLNERREAYLADQISYPEYKASELAGGLGLFFDVAGEGLMTMLSAMTPDRVENFLKEQIASGASAIASTETFQQLYNIWQELPDRAKESLGDIGDIVAGSAKKSVTVAGKEIKSPSKIVSDKLNASAVNSSKKAIAPKVLNQTQDAKINRGDELGMPSFKQFQTNFDEDVLNTLISLGITDKTKIDDILTKLNQENLKLGGKVAKTLNKVKGVVPASAIFLNFRRRLNDLVKEYPRYGEVKEFQNIVKRVEALLAAELKGFSGKPGDLIKLRQKFDGAVLDAFGDGLFEGQGASRRVVSLVRDSINNLADNVAMQTGDDSISALLRRQHLILEAKSNAAFYKSKQKELSKLRQAGQVVERHPFIAMSALGIGSGQGLLSQIPEGAVSLGMGALGLYGATTPTARRGIAEALDILPVQRSLFYGATQEPPPEEQR